MALTDLAPEISRWQARIDEALDRFTQWDAGCPQRLQEAIRYSLLGGGKRLRPLLVLMATEACGCDPELGLPAACAVEMVHAYSLVHDDLPAMDDDDLRRGRPTCHVAYDEATAILVGDALLARAFELAAGIEPATAAAQACRTLARAAGAAALVGGQADDLVGTQSGPQDLARLEAIHARKTGALFRASLLLGGITAGADPSQLELLDYYGKQLGLAFQIVDDLLDAAGDPDQVGKRTGKDAEAGKLTYPALLGLEASRTRAQELIAAAQRALKPLGTQARLLHRLAEFILTRTS